MELITTPQGFPAAYHVQNIKCYVKKKKKGGTQQSKLNQV